MGAQQPQSTGGIVRGMLAATEKLSSEDLAAYQRSQLEQLLRFAHAQAPYYKERLAPLFRKNGAIDWQRWQELPILTRADIKENGEAMMPKALPPGHGPTYGKASSGTTGTPITVYCSNLMATAGAAAFERACRWYGYSGGDHMCVVLSEGQLKSVSSKNWSLGNIDAGKLEGNNSSNRLAVSRNWPPASVLSLMEQHNSTCISGNAVTLEDLAEAQLEIRAEIRLKFMVGTSMALTERARELASQAFQARAFSAYSSKEAHKMAHECPVSGGLHVNSELVLVEILDDAGKSCGPGEMGRVIVTPLLGTAQPLIRYDHDDLATWGGPCACGRAHPLIARINGRVRNQFCFVNGHPLAPAIGHEPYRDLLKADRWQVAQTGALDIEVRYISSAPDEAIDFNGLTRVFRHSFHKNLKVTYRRVETMPLTAAGKFMDYVNEYVV